MSSLPKSFLPMLIVSVLLLSARGSGSAQPPNPRTPESWGLEPNTSGDDPKENPAASQVSTAELSIPHAGPEKIGAKKKTSEADDSAKSVAHDTFWVECVIAGATVIYSFFAILQWCALRTTVNETQNLVATSNRQAQAMEAQVINLEKTLAATEKAANAANESAETSRKALHADRPYLLIESASMENFQSEHEAFRKGDPAAGMPVVVNFGFENFGKSPAVIQKIMRGW